MKETNKNVFELKETVKSWDEDYYHPIAESYYDKAIAKMLKLMGIKSGELIVDGGCGPGVHSIRAAKQGCQVLAIDISQTMVEEAKIRAEKAGCSNAINFQQENLTQLSFADASFQYVFSWGVIIHIRDIEKALDELSRIVKPGGKLALYITNEKAWDHIIESTIRFLLNKPLSEQKKFPMGKGIYYNLHQEDLWVWQLDTDAVAKHLETHGFKKIHHVIGEFTEIQRRTKGILRNTLLKLNNLCYDWNFSPSIATTNLLIFEKNQ